MSLVTNTSNWWQLFWKRLYIWTFSSHSDYYILNSWPTEVVEAQLEEQNYMLITCGLTVSTVTVWELFIAVVCSLLCPVLKVFMIVQSNYILLCMVLHMPFSPKSHPTDLSSENNKFVGSDKSGSSGEHVPDSTERYLLKPCFLGYLLLKPMLYFVYQLFHI